MYLAPGYTWASAFTHTLSSSSNYLPKPLPHSHHPDHPPPPRVRSPRLLRFSQPRGPLHSLSPHCLFSLLSCWSLSLCNYTDISKVKSLEESKFLHCQGLSPIHLHAFLPSPRHGHKLTSIYFLCTRQETRSIIFIILFNPP